MVTKAISADIHCHPWSAFSEKSRTINSRLIIILNELKRKAEMLAKADGKVFIIAGDLFHTRGNIAPSVLNPLCSTLEDITKKYDFEVIILAGNHDLEMSFSEDDTSAITSLRNIKNVSVVNSTTIHYDYNLAFIPWIEDIEQFKAEVDRVKAEIDDADCDDDAEDFDLIIHAPIDNVIDGLPSHGLSADFFDDKFKRVFCGHYHNHKDFKNGVYSIGAIAHHTWSDVNSKAGFLLVDDDEVEWIKSSAPEFVDLTEDMDEVEILAEADGNYVRATVKKESKHSEIEALRKAILDAGAKGVIINSVKEPAKKRASTSTVKSMSLADSVNSYIESLDQTSEVAAKVAAKVHRHLAG